MLSIIEQAVSGFGQDGDLRLGHLFIAAQDLARMVEQRACGLETCRFTFGRGDEGQDSASVYIGLRKKPAYVSYEHYGYMSHPNTADLQFRIDSFDKLNLPNTYGQWLDKSAKGIHNLDLIDHSAVGAKLKYSTGVRQLYHKHEFLPFD